MPDAPKVDRYSPSFQRFNIQNNRTGFKPVSLPLILVVPGRRINGVPVANSDVFNVRFYIQDAPDRALVAGIEHKGLYIPNSDLFSLNISRLQLVDSWINLDAMSYYWPNDPTTTYTHTEAQDGMVFDYTTVYSDIRGTITYYADADYYDVSRFALSVEDLPRPKAYIFVWECQYYRRIILDPDQASIRGAFCMGEDIKLTRFSFTINHPGDIHNEMFRKTPALYFKENVALQDDKLLEFYRPFADLLQDIADEQDFIYGVNFIDRIPIQLLPYLAYLIGWDLPNYPSASDNLRRAMLHHAVYLQQLKGTRRAINELFEIFGFTIELINLWYSSNGLTLISPDETPPPESKDDKIITQEVCQIEPMMANYSTSGFGTYEIPLMYKASGNITLNAWILNNGATVDALKTVVEQLTNNPDILVGQCETSSDGFLIPRAIVDIIQSSTDVVAYSELLINRYTGLPVANLSSSVPILNTTNVKYDKLHNTISMSFDHYIEFNDTTLFLFATYPRVKLTIPDQIKGLRSNRFDVKIILEEEEVPEIDLLEFLMNFLFKLKAFHSLLRKIKFDLTFSEIYNVQDYCSDDFDKYQVPPPEIPTTVGCTEPVVTANSILRNKIYELLTEEHTNWKNLDGTHQATQEGSKVPVNVPIGTTCQFTSYGQDRVIAADIDTDQVADTREKLCELVAPAPPFCFKGRVKDELIINPVLPLTEISRCKPCQLSFGSGFYWMYDTNTTILLTNGFGQFDGQNIRSFLGKKIYEYNHPNKSLHFSDRPEMTNYQLDKAQLLAYQKPQIEIQKDNLGFPGHRFVTHNKLKTDFTSTYWNAKPWDDPDNDLNAKLVTGTNGDQHLVFDTEPLVYSGNNMDPDISSYGTHDDRLFLVTHKVYMHTAASHPAIELDWRVTVTDEESIKFDSSVPFDPIFRSYSSRCNTDYRSGYPSDTGRFSVDPSSLEWDRGASDLGGDVLGLPVRTSTTDLSALFRSSSQVLLDESDYLWGFYKPYRNDCECSVYGCDATYPTASTDYDYLLNIDSCLLNVYLQPDGTHDFNCDQLHVDPKAILTELFGCCSFVSDGELSTSFCVSPETPERGTIRYKDSYDVIYEISWVFKNDSTGTWLDMTSVTKSPHVWGQPDSGYIDNLRVYRRGIVTTIRMIIKITGYNQYSVEAKWEDQKIDTFQINAVCGDVPFVDNFCNHLDCMIQDDIQTIIDCGPRWVDPSDIDVEWPELVTNTAGVVTGYSYNTQPFLWVNIWANDDSLVHVCGTGGTGTA